MEIYLNNDQVREYLTILDETIKNHYKSTDKAIHSMNEGATARNEGIIVGLTTARDILFMISEKKGSIKELPKFTLDYFLRQHENE